MIEDLQRPDTHQHPSHYLLPVIPVGGNRQLRQRSRRCRHLRLQNLYTRHRQSRHQGQLFQTGNRLTNR